MDWQRDADRTCECGRSYKVEFHQNPCEGHDFHACRCGAVLRDEWNSTSEFRYTLKLVPAPVVPRPVVENEEPARPEPWRARWIRKAIKSLYG